VQEEFSLDFLNRISTLFFHFLTLTSAHRNPIVIYWLDRWQGINVLGVHVSSSQASWFGVLVLLENLKKRSAINQTVLNLIFVHIYNLYQYWDGKHVLFCQQFV